LDICGYVVRNKKANMNLTQSSGFTTTFKISQQVHILLKLQVTYAGFRWLTPGAVSQKMKIISSVSTNIKYFTQQLVNNV